MAVDEALFVRSYQAFVEALQRSGHEIRTSVLKNGVWTVIVNPRPLVTIRTRFAGSPPELAVAVRKPFIYREEFRASIDEASLDAAVGRAVAVHGSTR